MRIGIIAAMQKELDLLIPMLSGSKVETRGHLTFHVGKMGGNEVVLLRCGIGKVNAAIGAVTMINAYSPELMINSGVAGGADATVHIMDVVVGARVAYHDVWCGPETVLGAVQGLPLYYEGARNVIEKIPSRPDVKVGLIASGDQFVDSRDALLRIKQVFPDVLAVDMESGAISQVAFIYHVPFVSIRVISDSPLSSQDNTAQYQNFWDDAPKHTFGVLLDMLNN